MLPRWHVVLGAIFTSVIWIFAPQVGIFYLLLIFAASFLIDFDHYACFVMKTKKLSLKKSFSYHNKLIKKQREEIKKGIKTKFPDFHLFHTIEFHVLIGLLGLLWTGFFYIFIGMLFHSLLDVIDLTRGGAMHVREFFFFKWFYNKIR
nr:hypothetical protein [uncultured archaeon]AQS29478.1 hypothetical protein [uncultured archaeon]